MVGQFYQVEICWCGNWLRILNSASLVGSATSCDPNSLILHLLRQSTWPNTSMPSPRLSVASAAQRRSTSMACWSATRSTSGSWSSKRRPSSWTRSWGSLPKDRTRTSWPRTPSGTSYWRSDSRSRSCSRLIIPNSIWPSPIRQRGVPPWTSTEFRWPRVFIWMCKSRFNFILELTL